MDSLFLRFCKNSKLTLRPGIKYSHEEMGSKMIEYVFDKYNIDLEKQEIKLI